MSDIAVGCGTNRNEAFHRYVNTFFHESRIGILLSYALMMTIVHQYNTRNRDSRKSIFKPLKRDECNGMNDEPIGIAKPTEAFSDQSWQQDQSGSDAVDTTIILNILQASLSQLFICKTLKSKTDTASSLWKYIPYSQMLPSHQLINHSDESDVACHKARLQTTMKSWNFALLPVVADGNCFFTSVAIALVNSGDQSKSAISSLGLTMLAPITTLALRLRQVLVQEWLGSNRHEYECFISNATSFDLEASKFLLDRFYNNDLGNTMPLAMANALKVSFVIFTSLSSSPVFIVSPREPADEILYLAYTYCGPGHYDGAIFKGETRASKIKCRCGVNTNPVDKENQVSCTHTRNRSLSCKCLAAGTACSSSCGCKGCSNPNGRRPTHLGKRKREQHQWQKITVPNKKFARDKGEQLVQGVWSDFENMVLSNTLHYIQSSDLSCDASSVLTVFNSVAQYANAPYCSVELSSDVVIRVKSEAQVDSKLQHLKREKELFAQVSS